MYNHVSSQAIRKCECKIIMQSLWDCIPEHYWEAFDGSKVKDKIRGVCVYVRWCVCVRWSLSVLIKVSFHQNYLSFCLIIWEEVFSTELFSLFVILAYTLLHYLQSLSRNVLKPPEPVLLMDSSSQNLRKYWFIREFVGLSEHPVSLSSNFYFYFILFFKNLCS